jgi:RNA polymerase sigma-70 factor (ECF subfamily)
MKNPQETSEFLAKARSGSNPAGAFSTTHWSVVLEAGRDNPAAAAAALERLCGVYWYPVYAFIRRRFKNYNHQDAEDVAQGFFAQLLAQEALKKLDRQKGKFRSFILASLTNFLNNDWDQRQTLKRGGKLQIVSLDETHAEEIYARELVAAPTPEKLFDRRWAQAVVERVLARLKAEYVQANKSKLFEKIESGLTREVKQAALAEWAVALDMSDAAVKIALHRLRRRYGELLREEIAQTVATPEELDEEIRHLCVAMAG